MFDPELKKGTTPFLVLSLLADGPRHGYELSKLIATRSQGMVTIHAASLYPLLYRLEKDGLLAGRWVEAAGKRRRRYYHLTAAGRSRLETQRRGWAEFVRAVSRITGVEYA